MDTKFGFGKPVDLSFDEAIETVTEELGKARARKHQGALTAIRLMAGYMRWIIERGVDSGQVRCSFWGATAGNPEANAVTGLDVVYEFLGDGQLLDVSDGAAVGGITDAARVYAYRDLGQSRTMTFATSVLRDRRNAVRWIEVGQGARRRDVTLFAVSADGLVPVDFRIERGKAVLDERVKIGPGTGFLALVHR